MVLDKLTQARNSQKVEGPIDFIIPWVDGSDPAWLAEKARYAGSDFDIEDSAARYRDWGLLRYWFRGVERFAPWVRTIHFVTWGHVPEWLNLDHPKLHLVRHEDYIPHAYLPSFSANTIELNFHRIGSLAEHFVYFNDDMFLVGPTTPQDFFEGGLPKLTAIATPLKVTYGDWFYMPIVDNAVINRHFNFHKAVRDNFFKWFNPVYGANALRTLTVLPYPYFCGIMELHLPNSLTKQAYREVWAAEPEILDRTCRNHVRSRTDVNQYLIKNWIIAEGRFLPRPADFGKAFQFRGDSADVLRSLDAYLHQGKGKTVCVNDTATVENVDSIICSCQGIMQAILPEPSSFER